jgi:hypothetical protein
MDYPMSISLLRARFHSALEQDDFVYAGQSTRFPSLRSFITYITTAAAASAAGGIRSKDSKIGDLKITLNEFLTSTIPCELGETSIAAIAIDYFCLKSIPGIARSCMHKQVSLADQVKLFSEVGATDHESWVIALINPSVKLKISMALFEDMIRALGDRTLRSFFVYPKVENGFSTCSEHSRSWQGIPLKTLVKSDERFKVTVHISKYNEDVDTDDVSAYEWYASLSRHDEVEDQVRACGMIYTFRRTDGTPHGGRRDLMVAADSVSDIDVFQVHAFLAQNQDAESLLKKGDICLIWLWERRDNAPRGQGAECLRLVGSLLKKRFRNLRTFAFNILPRQYIEWEEAYEPSAMTVEKYETTEVIASHVRKLKLPRSNVRVFIGPDDNRGDGDKARLIVAEEIDRDS